MKEKLIIVGITVAVLIIGYLLGAHQGVNYQFDNGGQVYCSR